MKVCIFGATGKTGQYVWQEAVKQGYEVSVFVRSVNKIPQDTNVNIIQGDVFDQTSVTESLQGQDAVIICLGSSGIKDRTTLSNGTEKIIKAMQQHNVSRLIVLSIAGAAESWGKIPILSKILFSSLLKNIYNDHCRQEALINQSNLKWTVVRAAILKDKPFTADYSVGTNIKTKTINRADLAHFLVNQLSDNKHLQQAICITN